jgi:hypothetical protein
LVTVIVFVNDSDWLSLVARVRKRIVNEEWITGWRLRLYETSR